MSYYDALRDTRFPLQHGSKAMPGVGFGTLFKDLSLTTQAVTQALEAGFRHFDCAERYGNEAQVGVALRQAIEAGTVTRDELFITTKLWNNNHRPERVVPAFEASCRRLQVDVIDCYMIHTPHAFLPGDDLYPRDVYGHVRYDAGVTLIETWQVLERLVDEGRCTSIGLSAISLPALRELVAVARIKPAVVQVESHPYLPEWELLEYCKQQGIVVLAFAPLGHGMKPRVLDEPVINSIARRVQKTPAQVALAWSVQRGVAFLTSSVTPAHIREDSALSALPQAAMREIERDITTRVRFNPVMDTGVLGFISREK
ncbi:aldo/keto reductase [Pseudomonas sp. SDO528_S397]